MAIETTAVGPMIPGGPSLARFQKSYEKRRPYRDAIQYVHDAVVKGMNDGKDVFTLMREIKLPANLEVGEGYGQLTWSIRGIYEGYAGWFDGNPATMYESPASSAFPDLVKLAGGPGPVADLAMERVKGEFQANTWKAFWLTAVEGASTADAAKKTGLSPGAIYVAKSRVLARLKEEVDGLRQQEEA